MRFNFGFSADLSMLATSAEETMEPVTDAAPAVEETAEPVTDAAPAVEETTEPVTDAVPAVEETAEPVTDAVPAAGETTETEKYTGLYDIATRFINNADERGYSRDWKTIENEHDKSVERLLEKTNPKFDANNYYYSFNCQRCVPAYEMRCRGFDVEAKPVEREKDYLSYHPYAVWENPEVQRVSSGTGESEIRSQMAQWGDGARCQVCVTWDPKTGIGGGHTFIAEQVDGETHFYDPQTNDIDVQDYFQDCQEGRRTRADGPWHNRKGDLPTVDNEGNVISYREHDVNDCIDGERRDSERFVTGSDGSVYYTDDHYRSFSRIIGE